ncbi:MAG: preprotein translocase subunit YajC [Gemmatimonadales bacterium]
MTISPGIAPLLLQVAAQAPGLGGYAPILFNVGLIFAIWYFLVIRPQQKQRKSHEQSLYALRKGDEVVTAGGLVGEVAHIKEGLKEGQPLKTLDDRITIKSGESKVVVERGRIAKVSSATGGESKAG